MREKHKSHSIENVSDLPEHYDILSSIKDTELYVPLAHREALAIIRVADLNTGLQEYSIIVNISSKFKMNYKTYLTTLTSMDDVNFKIIKCKNREVLDSIYATVQEGDETIDNFDSDIINEVNDLIFDALELGVSDVHIEVREIMSKIRFRKNGALYTKSQITYSKGEKMGIVLYQALSTESGVVFNPNVPQDAMVDSKFNGVRARLRIATAPASPSGFDMVIRILKFGEKSSYTLLTELGYTEGQAKTIYSFSSDPIGATIIAGTTGSGKSTTLKNLITKKIMDHKATLKVITVEDPPEYEIQHATQIPVIRDDTGSGAAGFASAIRTAMRSDPDILMIGEVRDSQSAALLVGATQSGHQVLSTVHAPSAVGIISRLESLGISRDVLSSSDFISGFIYQKLLPKLCQNCAIAYKNDDGSLSSPHSEESIAVSLGKCESKDILKIKATKRNSTISRSLQDDGIISEKDVKDIKLEFQRRNHDFLASGFDKRLNNVLSGNVSGVKYKGMGCSECDGTGLTGRMVVAEILTPNKEILNTIKAGNDLETKKVWLESISGTPIMETALGRVVTGMVDPIDVEKEIGTIDVSN